MLNANHLGAGRHRRTLKLVVFALVFFVIVAPRPRTSGTTQAAEAPPSAAPATAQPAIGSGGEMFRAEYQQYTWHRDDPPVRMISKDEGFCFLSEVAGHFSGGNEAASVYIGEDGFWYLGGHGGEPLRAKAYSVKFSRKVVASVVPPPDPAAEAWQQTLGVLAQSTNDSVKALAARESTAFPTEPADVLKLADAWNEAAPKSPAEQRPMIESHLLHLYQVTLGRLSGSQLEQALARLQQLRLTLATERLNQFASWNARKGQWSATPEGIIEGRGDSELVLENALPPNCLVEFHAIPLEGMRTRIYFPGTSVYIGNEGFTHQIDVFGGETRRTVPHPYVNGEDMKLGIKFVGKAFEFYVNGELQGKGTRTVIPSVLGIALHSGDDFDKGITRFWDFKVSAVQ